MAVPFRLAKLNLSIQLLVVLSGALLFGKQLPETLQAALYTISLTIKGFLLFILPIVIFSCLFSCLLTFRGKKAIGFMLILFGVVCLSNYLSTLIAYGVGNLPLTNLEILMQEEFIPANELAPLWNIAFPQWLPNDYALYLGFGIGALFSFFPNPTAYQFSIKAKQFVTLFLKKGFLPLLPIFALGFILKMQHDGILTKIIQSYLSLIGITILTYLFYLGLLFALAANFNPTRWFRYLKNVLPVALTGFSTMSSLATMPVTLNAAEKNTGNIDLARAIIPATVNVHMVGVSIAIPLMAFSILLSFGYELPNFVQYCQFAFAFVLAQFAVAGIPGGAILVMLPILEKHFGFTGEMSALITALYILFDPVVTTTNVLGNSALVILITKLLRRVWSQLLISDSHPTQN